MAYKIIEATASRVGTVIMLDGAPCTVKNIDISKTGKHGHAKCRIEAVGVIDGKKRVIAVPGHERFEVPLVNKKKGQVLSVTEKTASVMDLETFETVDVPIGIDVPINPEDQVEYWDIEGQTIIKRKL